MTKRNKQSEQKKKLGRTTNKGKAPDTQRVKVATQDGANQKQVEFLRKANSTSVPPRPFFPLKGSPGGVSLIRRLKRTTAIALVVPPQSTVPVVPPEPQITDPNPVPALMIAARRWKEAGDNEEQCLCDALGISFEGAVLADNDPKRREHIRNVWQEAEHKTPRMDDFNSLLRHVVALTRSPQKPGDALKEASFYTRAMTGLPHTMRAAEVSEALKIEGIKNRAHETAKRRAALKVSSAPAEVTSEDPGNEDQPCSPEPHGDDPAVKDVVSAGDEAAATDGPDLVTVATVAEPHAVRVLHATPVGGQVVATITRDTSDKFRIEEAHIMKP